MATLLVQIAPQRSTQYSSLASALAPVEIQLCAVGKNILSIEPIVLGGQHYLKCAVDAELQIEHFYELGILATGSAYFEYHDTLGERAGPFLRPLETAFSPAFAPDLVTSRRYHGKTNEMFTHFMCNLARFSSDFAAEPWSNLRLFDPLAGGGTTLFVALVLGADVAGVEQNSKSIQSTAVFLKQYAQEKQIPFTLKEERLKKLNARRWWFTLVKEKQRRCVLAKGEIEQDKELLAGFKRPHFIVADLPYGIQHKGGLQELLTTALPVWHDLLLPGGSLVFAWESTRFSREAMIDVVESESLFNVFDDTPYDQLDHRVDRVIKHRDVIAAYKAKGKQ